MRLEPVPKKSIRHQTQLSITMNTCLTVQKFGGLRTALLAAFAITSAHAQITVDGIRDGLDTGYTERAVQATTTNWGSSNALANLHTAQAGSNLAVFLGGRPDGNAFILFIDSKPGGVNFIPNNLITVGDEAYTINKLGTSPTAGMTFETGFTADYAVRIYGTGSNAYVARYNLQTGTRDSLENAGLSNQGPSGFVTDIRAAWLAASPPYNTAINGVEMKLSLAALGVPSGAGQSVKTAPKTQDCSQWLQVGWLRLQQHLQKLSALEDHNDERCSGMSLARPACTPVSLVLRHCPRPVNSAQ